MRITTWNVNGIRNPFGYQPWREQRTFSAMFDILEADIVVMQELKIQRKDLTDDMVLVPGWDCYFSLPKHKKGDIPRCPICTRLIRLRLLGRRHLHPPGRVCSHPCRGGPPGCFMPTHLFHRLQRPAP